MNVMLIVLALIIGFSVGYLTNDFLQQEIDEDKDGLNEENEEVLFEVGDNLLLNSGFENGTDVNISDWFKAWIPADNLTMTADTNNTYLGQRSAYINNTHVYQENVSNNWAQTIESFPNNRTIELTGWVKTIDAESVVMVVQCWDENNSLIEYATTQLESPINGTNDWALYNTSLKVPTETNEIFVRLALSGTGQVWFDDVKLLVK